MTVTTLQMADPILKWAGGKRQLLDELYDRFPSEYSQPENAYHEPFLGGGALFFDHQPSTGTINDTNPRLARFYRTVRNNPTELISRCREFKQPTTTHDLTGQFADAENFYYQQRERFNWLRKQEDANPVEEAALLLYLNRTCFNGIYRENADGEFNVPIGDNQNPDWVRADEIRAASTVLQNLPSSAIKNADFSYVLETAEPGDLVYFDPPYEPMSSTAYFTDYSAEGFDKADQERLLEAAQTLDERGIHIVLSNSGVTYDMYDEAGFYVDRVLATRVINSDAENRDGVEEVIVTNVPPAERGGYGNASLDAFF